MNRKATAKTTFVQRHHKVRTFENLSRHLVLVVQNVLMDCVGRAFRLIT